MQFSDAVELSERHVMEIVKDWPGFKTSYAKLLKAKGQEAANQYAKQWLGPMEGYKGVEDLKARLTKAGVQLDPKVDEIMLKVLDSVAGDKKVAAAETVQKGQKVAAREKEIAGNLAVDKGPVKNI